MVTESILSLVPVDVKEASQGIEYSPKVIPFFNTFYSVNWNFELMSILLNCVYIVLVLLVNIAPHSTAIGRMKKSVVATMTFVIFEQDEPF